MRGGGCEVRRQRRRGERGRRCSARQRADLTVTGLAVCDGDRSARPGQCRRCARRHRDGDRTPSSLRVVPPGRPDGPRGRSRVAGALVSRWRREDGSALVEFTWLAILLMIPLVYVVLAALSLQRAAFAETAAAREAARAYATAGSDAEGERRAEQAGALAMRDQGIAWVPSGRVISCGACDYRPGSTFTVDLQRVVALPFVPKWMCGDRCVAGITVSVHHHGRIDCYGAVGVAPAPTC